MLTKSRWKQLEKRWERKRRERTHAHGYIVEIPDDPDDPDNLADMASLYGRPRRARRRAPSGPAGQRSWRPPGLRATDLVQGLAGLALEWGDRRFAQCARALFELDIVDKQGRRFTKKRGPYEISLIDSALDYAVMEVRKLREKDPSLLEREACAVIAADLGWGATRTTSFQAAWEQLRQASRQARWPRG